MPADINRDLAISGLIVYSSEGRLSHSDLFYFAGPHVVEWRRTGPTNEGRAIARKSIEKIRPDVV
jgi:hypothetical protein